MSAAALLAAAPAQAQTKRWDGSSNDLWFNAANWQSPGIPGLGNTVLIDTSLAAPNSPRILNGDAVATSVAVTNKSLEVSTLGTLSAANTISTGTGGTFTAHNGAAVIANIDFRVNDGGSATIDNATLTTDNIEVGFAGATPGSLLAVVNGAVVNVNQGVNAGAGTVFVGGTSDATLAIGQGGTAGTVNAATVDLGTAGSKVAFEHTGTATFAPAIVNLGQVEAIGPGTTILTGANSYAGATTIAAGTLQIGNGGTTGALGAGAVVNNATLAFNRSDTLTVANAISGTGAVSQIGAGTTILTGANTYMGATAVNAGALIVNGSIASSSMTTVNPGAVLGGTGTVGNTAINGGTLAPGASIGTIAVQGNLAFSTAAAYLVEVSPTAADRTNATGTATLAGTVQALFEPGSYVARSYTILSAAGGLGGSTFGALTTNLPGFATSLSYTTTDVLLNLTAQLGAGTPLNPNQTGVATAINTFFNSGGALPPGFATVFGLAGSSLGNALTQLSGGHGTGLQPAGSLSTGMFLNLMLDPFVSGRTGGFGAALSYAAEPRSRARAAAEDAYAAAFPVKGPPPPAAFTAARQWSLWGAAYGGRNRTDGDPGIGSNDLSARTGGFAAGADYRASPDTVIGAAVAIGETRWTVSGLGTGGSNLAQAGGYASTRWGNAYLSAAVAGAWHDAETDRTVAIAGTDRLEADFNAKAIGARAEAGWRFGVAQYGVTPYAAVQVQSLRTPAYAETAAQGSNQFALAYAAQTATDTRSEAGVWIDARRALANGARATLRARAAWVHDFNPGSRIQAAFQTLPGASFTIDGASAPRDSALTSAVAELRLRNGFTLAAKFDGEFARGSRTLAGTGAAKYAW